MAISVIVAVEPVADALIEKITARMADLRIGDGRRGCDMGPLITGMHRDKVSSYVDIAEQDGALRVEPIKAAPDGLCVLPCGESGRWTPKR